MKPAIGVALGALVMAGACAPKSHEVTERGDISPQARSVVPTQADPVQPDTGMTNRELRQR